LHAKNNIQSTLINTIEICGEKTSRLLDRRVLQNMRVSLNSIMASLCMHRPVFYLEHFAPIKTYMYGVDTSEHHKF
jgi:hypothetical protein